MRLVLSAIVMVILGVSAAEADVFKSVDEDGVVCYTDIPLSRTAEKVMRTPGDTSGTKEREEVSPKREIHSIVREKASKYEIDPSLIHAVIKAESNGNPHAVSRKGAMGLMQLMPMTAQDLEVSNPFDPEENIDGGTRYLRYLIDKFNGDLTLALAAYNAGPKTVEKSGAVPRIPETKQYVQKVLSLYGGKRSHPAPSVSSSAEPDRKPNPIYKVLTEDGTVLFTNLPLGRKYPRF